MTQIRSALPQQPQHILDEIGMWSVVVPEAGTNLITNPSFENGTTGWTDNGTVSMARSTAQSAFGAASLAISTNTHSTGTYTTVTSGTTNGATYTLSMWARGLGDVFIYAYGDVSLFIAIKGFTLTNNWQRYTLTFTFGAADTSRIVGIHQNGSGTRTFYIDGAQLEARPYPTTYIDGDQEGCYWTGAPHASSSSRLATARQGGRVVPFKKYNWRTTALVGLQVAALNTISTPYALIGGGYYQRSVAPPRAFSIVGGFDCQSQIDLARARNEMAQALVPFATAPDTPVRLVYEPLLCNSGAAAGRKLLIDAVYTGGLEGNQTNDVGIERHALGFRVHLPFAALGKYETDVNQPVALSDDIPDTDNIGLRDTITGVISPMDTGIADGEVLAAIQFDGGPIFGTYDPVNDAQLLQWNGSSFNDFQGGAVTGNYITSLAIDVDGDLLVGGQFTNIGGTAMTNVGRYDVGGGGWTAMGSGLNNRVQAIARTQGGVPIAGGLFTGYLAGWDGLSWSTLGTFNGAVYAIVNRPGTNTVYIGGNFTSPATRIVQYTVGGGGSFPGLGSGFNDQVNVLAIGPDGTLYAGGSFTASGAISCNYIARWTGFAWLPLGEGTDAEVTNIGFDMYGRLLASGPFNNAGGIDVDGAAIWDGSQWLHPGFGTSTQATNGVLISGSSEYWYGGFANLIGPANTTVINAGSTANPIIKITGPGTPVKIQNATTGDAIYMQYSLVAGEVVTIVTGANASIRSSINGNLSAFLLPGSNIANFKILSGSNVINAYVSGSTGSSAINIIYRQTVGSLDQAF